jgi:hypothetical protein
MLANPDVARRRLELELRVPGDPVPLGEEVTITVALVNRDSVPVLVNQRLLPAPEGGPKALSEINLEVQGPPGYVNRKAVHVNSGRARPEDFAELAPGQAVERSLPLTRFHSLQVAGEYGVRATYANVEAPDRFGGQAWTGELTSDWAAIRRA